MNKWLAIGLVILVLGAGACASMVGMNNNLVTQEAGIKAQYKQNQNNYDNMWKKFREASQVPKQYKNDLKEVYDSAIQQRYGKNGSQAMFQWLKEHNPNFDSSMYTHLQQLVEAGRNSFEANQKMLLDKRRQYEVDLNIFPNSMVAGFLGFPKIDLDKYDIVTSERTEEAFETKKAEEVQLFN
jgi:hypothetical protein